MTTRRYRLAGHAVAAVLLSGVAVVATGAGAGAATVATQASATRADSYAGDTTAASMEFRLDKQPFNFPVNDPFHNWIPYADTSIDSSGGAESIASTVYPGQGVLGVPALLCEFNAQLCDNVISRIPNYPDWAHAQYPAHPDDSATLSQKPFPGSGPFEITPNKVDAHADPNRVTALAATNNSGLTGVVTVQSASSNSAQKFVGSTLVLTAESVLKGVDIGGQLHIDEIRSTATGKIDGAKVATSSASTTVSGATVAGQGVTIDSTGIHAGPGGDNGLLKKTLNTALHTLGGKGITVRSLGITHTARPHKVEAQTGGVLVIAKQTVNVPQSLPGIGGGENGDYTLTANLAGAGINAFASPSQGVGSVTLPSTPPVSAGAPPPPSTTGTSSTPATQTQSTGSGQQPAVAGSTPQQENAALPIDLTNKRLKTLALVLLGYPLLVLMAAPFRAPSRLPRGGG